MLFAQTFGIISGFLVYVLNPKRTIEFTIDQITQETKSFEKTVNREFQNSAPSNNSRIKFFNRKRVKTKSFVSDKDRINSRRHLVRKFQ